MTLDRDSLLNNRYRIVEILGQGGMGSIYRAVDENLGVDVAVKENLFTTEEYARQFRREAVILANLRHPNLPRVTDHFVIEPQGQYLVMDYVEGEDLRERMEREGTFSDADAVILGAAVCDALSYLHSRQPQIVHRDIKPGNVKISPSGQIILVDFGLAKLIQGGEATTSGARAMTPGYSPPEQYGTARTDHRSDVYSLGATLYVALTAMLPEDALARAMGQSELTPIRKYNPKVSRRLAVVIERALELRPDDRYQSAEEFKQALLNTRVITGRKPATGPALTSPLAEGQGEAVGSKEVSAGMGVSEPVKRPSPSPAQISPFQLPASAPGARPGGRPAGRVRRKKRSGGCWIAGVLLFSLVIFSALGAYAYQPTILNQAADWIMPYLSSFGLPFRESSPTPSAAPPATIDTIPAPATITPAETSSSPSSSTLTALADILATERPTATRRPTQTPTPTATPIGGGSGQVAYASNLTGLPQIWLMKADGTAPAQISEMPEGACQPNWAPDGTRLAFISPCAFNQETYPGASIFIINVDGTGLVPLPTVPGGDFDPAWSPDGTHIAFTSLRDFNRAQIYVINLADNTVTSLSANKVRDSQPSWSPDGGQVVFVSTRRGPYQIWTMSSDGRDQTLFSRSGSLKDTHPVWSPDGQAILFTQSEVLGGIPRLVAVRVTEGNFLENRIVKDVIPMREASYSQDGAWIAYEGWPDGSNHDIFIMTSNGLGRQRLTDEAAFDFDPAWQPLPTQP